MAFQDTKAEHGIEESGTKKRKGGGGKYPKGKASKKEKPAGRKDGEQQSAVTRPKVVVEKIDHLVNLQRDAKDAATDLDEAIKAVAEESGYLAGTVRKLVKAKYADKYEERRREIEQQAELFAEAE